jgi:hypothetical protein
MMDRVGKVFIAYPPLRRGLGCEQLFSLEGAEEHSRVPCFPQSDLWCPTIPYGVVLGEA